MVKYWDKYTEMHGQQNVKKYINMWHNGDVCSWLFPLGKWWRYFNCLTVYAETFQGMLLPFFHTGVIQHLHCLKTKQTLTDFLTNVSKYTLKLRGWKYVIILCIIMTWHFVLNGFRYNEYLAYPPARTGTHMTITENCHLEAWDTLWCVVGMYRNFRRNCILHI